MTDIWGALHDASFAVETAAGPPCDARGRTDPTMAGNGAALSRTRRPTTAEDAVFGRTSPAVEAPEVSMEFF